MIVGEDHSNFLQLILQNNHESYHTVVEGIYEDVILKHHVNPKNIILISQSRDIDREIEVVSKKYNKEKIQANWLRIFEHDASILINIENIEIPTTLEEKKCLQITNSIFKNIRLITKCQLFIFNYQSGVNLFKNLGK